MDGHLQTTGTFFKADSPSVDSFAEKFDAGTQFQHGQLESLSTSHTLPVCSPVSDTLPPLFDDDGNGACGLLDQYEANESHSELAVELSHCSEVASRAFAIFSNLAVEVQHEVPEAFAFTEVGQYEANASASDLSVAEVAVEPFLMPRAFYTPPTLAESLDMEPIGVPQRARDLPFMRGESDREGFMASFRPCRCGAAEEPRLQRWFLDVNGNLTLNAAEARGAHLRRHRAHLHHHRARDLLE
jgi:hypothetical protein